MGTSCFWWRSTRGADDAYNLLDGNGSPPHSSASSPSAFTKTVGTLGQNIVAFSRAIVPAPIAYAWTLGGNGLHMFTSWGGRNNRYHTMSSGKSKPAVGYYKLEDAGRSSCAKNRQDKQQNKVNGSVVVRSHNSGTPPEKLNALTRKPVAENVSNALNVWNTSEAVAEGLFPSGDPALNEANNPVLNAVKQKVSVDVWLNAKVLTPALAKFDVTDFPVDTIDGAIASLDKVAAGNDDQILQNKKDELQESANKEAIVELKKLIKAQGLEVPTESLTVDQIKQDISAQVGNVSAISEKLQEIHGNITKHVEDGLEQYKALAKDLAQALTAGMPERQLIPVGEPPLFSWTKVAKSLHNQIAGGRTSTENEALSELSATILREQRKCEHAQQQLVAELACYVHSQPAGLDSSKDETPAKKAIDLLNSLSPAPENHEGTDAYMSPSLHDPFSGDAFTFKCGLALTPNGMDALLCLEGGQGWTLKQQETYRNMLEVSAYLKMQLSKSGASNIKGVKSFKDMGLTDLLNEAGKHSLNWYIGMKNDDPLLLAFQALVHGVNELTGTGGPLAHVQDFQKTCGNYLGAKTAVGACKAGYVAWCNGFQTSGEGTEFNAALAKLSKFNTYYKRTTTHGARTAWNLTRDLVRLFRKTLLGQKKDPLLGAVSTGDMGSGFNLRVQEQREEFQARLKGGKVNEPTGYKGHKDYTHTKEGSVLGTLKTKLDNGGKKAQARQEILNLWMQKGKRSFRVHVGDTYKVTDISAREIEQSITKDTLDQAFGRRGFFHFRGPKVRLRTLEKWAVEAYGLNDGDWKKPLRMPYRELKNPGESGALGDPLGFEFLAQVNLLRRVANGGRLQGKDCGNLFQFSDLKNILLGRPARNTVDETMVKDTLLASFMGDEVISSVDSTYAGFDPGSIANLGLGKMAFGGLIANWSKGRDAIFQCGDGAHGSELIMGSMKHVRQEWGVRFGLSFARFDKFLKFGPFGSYSKVHDRATTGSRKKDGAVAILIPQDRDTIQVEGKEGKEGSTGSNKQIAEELTNFMMDLGKADLKGNQSITKTAWLWKAWSEKFDDPSRISLGFRELEYEGTQTRVEGGVAARVKWKDKYHGAMAGVTYVGVKATDKRTSKAGAHQLNRQTDVNEKFLMGYASLSQGSETMWSDDSMSANTRAIPFVGVGLSMALDTENAITRLLSERGQVNPVETNQDMVFDDTNAWVNHLAGTQNDDVKKDAWLYKKTASGYIPTTYKAWNGEEFVDVVAMKVGDVFEKVVFNNINLTYKNTRYTDFKALVNDLHKAPEHENTSKKRKDLAIEKALDELKKQNPTNYNSVIGAVFGTEIEKATTAIGKEVALLQGKLNNASEQDRPLLQAQIDDLEDNQEGRAQARVLGRLAVNTMVNEAHQHGPVGSNAKTTRWVLHPAAAEELTHIRSMVRTYRGMLNGLALHGELKSKAELVRTLMGQINAAKERATEIMNDRAFWQPKWITSANTVSKSSSFGISLGVRFGNSSSASSRPKGFRNLMSGPDRKLQANFSTPAVLKALAGWQPTAAAAA